jgi:hypothetical protein
MISLIDFTQRWIVDDNWTYTADISPFLNSQAFKQSKKTLLVFYGIDTIANIVRVFEVIFPLSYADRRPRRSRVNQSHGLITSSASMFTTYPIFSLLLKITNSSFRSNLLGSMA